MKIKLVTVVGDFHINLTFIQMLKHYEKMVDEMHVVLYMTDKVKSDRVRENFRDYLEETGIVYSNVVVHETFGEKFDWDFVTGNYNRITDTDKESYWIISDCDEFQVWPKEPRQIAEECEQNGYTFVTGGFLDRIGKEGTFPRIRDWEEDLQSLFPLVGFFRYPMSGACPNKVVLVKGGQKVCSGQHYAIFPDGTNSWGREHFLRYPIEKCFVQVHHFKYDYTVLKRLKKTAVSGCKYSDEYSRMYYSISKNNFIFDIQNPRFLCEEYVPEKGYFSYSNWSSVRDQIVKI